MTAHVALTFDDGPDGFWTVRVLEELDRVGARATFFVMAPEARAHHSVLEETLAGGHDVQLHCGRHLRHTEWSRATIERDTEGALAVLDGLGVRPRLWRVPWGVQAPWTPEIAAEHGLELVGWTLDTRDWRGDGAAEMLAAVEPGLEAGAVVLMHDGLGPGARRSGCAETVALIAPLVDAIRARGLEPGVLSSADAPPVAAA